MSIPSHVSAPVLENVAIAKDTYRIRVEVPSIASTIRPGQFLMLRLPLSSDPLLGRPFALYDAIDQAGSPSAIDVVYLVVGKLTRLLAQLQSGDMLDVWGPLGNGFPDLTGVSHVGLVAGGIGQTPFLAYVHQLLGNRGYGQQIPRRMVDRVTIYYGVRSADLLAGVDDFRAAGAEVHLATDDGSLGERGFVTDLLRQRDRPDHLIGCGPEPMLHSLMRLAESWNLPCHVSLETPMACGVGICFSCVTQIRMDDGWDYCRVCVDGPVFDAKRLMK